MARPSDALVLDLDTRAGLCLTRSLGRAGHRVAVAARDPAAPGLRTRHAAARFVLPEPDGDFEAYVAAVLDRLERSGAGVVLTSIDADLAVLHGRRDAVSRFAAPAVGSRAAVDVAVDKARTIEVAAALGIPAPRSLPARDADEVEAAAAELGGVVVVKPVRSWRAVGRGSERVEPRFAGSPAEARRIGEGLVRPDAPALVQEVATGGRETCKLFRVGGRTVASLTMTADRTWPPLGGSTVMRRIAAPGDTVAQAERLVAEIGLDGYSEVEFRRDAAGRALLMEINPRLSQSLEVAVRAGFDFGLMQFEWARGGRIPSAPTHAPVGLRVGWPGGELRLLAAAALGRPAPRPAPVATVRAMAGDYLRHGARLEGLDLGDLRPAVGSLGLLARGLTRGRGRRVSSARPR